MSLEKVQFLHILCNSTKLKGLTQSVITFRMSEIKKIYEVFIPVRETFPLTGDVAGFSRRSLTPTELPPK